MEREFVEEIQNGLFPENKAMLYHYTAVNGHCFSVMADTLEMCRKQRDKWIRKQSAAFTGHRFIHFSKKARIKYFLNEVITACYRDGIRFFLSGMAMGLDIMAAECVLELKCTFPDMALIAVVPFDGQEIRFNNVDKVVYNEIIQRADKVIVLSKVYFSACYLSRNDYLIRNSSCLIAYFDGIRKGGTAYTVHKAEKCKMQIYNLFQF